ncbi:vitamin K epoxide reductase family protein [Telluribacter humicola]|uniref:vitamin K epoxide reductase family protein n=1 Tax=Telluribacter humicola TaxID=1720261 RepID=UPI001A97BC62|nr:vitamin K epoxide reductase family protein [Telluribacter humicola]
MTPINAEKNAIDATKALLDFSKVRTTKLGLKEALEQHPDFPGLNAISDVLNDFQVPNLATRISPDRLHEIPLPALTYLTIDGGIFTLLRSVNGSVEWLHTQRGWQNDSLREFAQKWSGVALLIEPNEKSGEREYIQNRHRETLRVLLRIFMVSMKIVVLGFLISNLLQVFSWDDYSTYYLTGLFKLIGTILSGLLVWYSLDGQNEFLQRICQINNRTNCQNILSSQSAKITSWLSWAEVGLFYFAGGLLTLVAGLWRGSSEFLVSLGGSLYLLTVLALPYTIWSVYHQWRVARQWCILCLVVQALFWIEFLVAYENFGFPIQAGSWLASGSVWKIGVISFLMIPILWHWIKPQLKKVVAYQPLAREFLKLKFNEQLISSIFNTQQSMPPIFKEMEIIHLGNPEADHVLTVVINPLCWPCAVELKEINALLELQPKVRCQLIFVGGPEALEIASVFFSTEKSQQKEILHSWFQNIFQDRKKWVEAYKKDVDNINAMFKIHSQWCDLAGVTGTPTTFFNGREFPTSYSIKDINEIIKYVKVESEFSIFQEV